MNKNLTAYINDCKSKSKIIVVAKNILKMSQLVEKDGIVVSQSGFLFDVWNEIAKANNYSFCVIKGIPEIVGSPTDSGSWTGMIGMVLNQTADIIVAPVSVTDVRAKVVEFTLPLYEESTCVLTTQSTNKGAQNKFLNLFKPFEYNVWLCIIILGLIYSILFYLMHHLITKKNEKFMNSFIIKSNDNSQEEPKDSHTTEWTNYLFFIFGKLLMEDVNMQHLIYVKSERVLLLSWWMFAIIINSLYTSVLVSLLVVVKYEPEISAVEDLAKLDNYKLCLQSGGYQIDFLKSLSGNYRKIYDYIMNNPSQMNYLTLADTIFMQAWYGNCFGFVDKTVGSIFVSTYNSLNITCVDSWAPASISFAHRKNWIYGYDITQTITKLHENGIISLLMRNTLNSYLKQEKTQVSETKPIGFDSLSSIFILHAIFLAIAIVYQVITIILNLKRVQEKFVKPMKSWLKNSSFNRNILNRFKKKKPNKIEIEYLSSPVPDSPSTNLSISDTTTESKSTSASSLSLVRPKMNNDKSSNKTTTRPKRKQPTKFPLRVKSAFENYDSPTTSILAKLYKQNNFIMLSTMNNSALLRLSRTHLNKSNNE